jgi:hypothetical protein
VLTGISVEVAHSTKCFLHPCEIGVGERIVLRPPASANPSVEIAIVDQVAQSPEILHARILHVGCEEVNLHLFAVLVIANPHCQIL